MMRRFLALSACLVAFSVHAQTAADDAFPIEDNPLGSLESQPMKAIEIRALNKITARTSLMKVNFDEMVQFDALRVQVRTCWSAPPDKRPEHAALLRVVEMDPDKGPQQRFHGWMFASSPALNALEHPVYDITVLRCLPKRVEPEVIDDALEDAAE